MSALAHYRLTPRALRALVDDAPTEDVTITEDHRRAFAARLRAVPSDAHRRVDAWSVERAGANPDPFAWTPTTAKRLVAAGALRRAETGLDLASAVREEIEEQLLRCASGWARPGSLARWLAEESAVVRAMVQAAALETVRQLRDVVAPLDEVRLATADAYYDVPGARTTLRARRDALVPAGDGRVLLRLRAGAPGKSAGPGLRADLFIEALAEPSGVAARRIIGLWPEAGVMLSVEGTMSDLRAGARDLVRTAVVQQRALRRRAA